MFKLLRKRLFKTSRSKGFTLTELIVVVAIVGILMACVTAFAGPIRRTIQNTSARSDAITINEILGSYLERKLAYAETIKAFVGYDYATGGDLGNAFNFVLAKSGITGETNTPGMIVMHFVPGGTDDVYGGSYYLYEVSINKDTTKGVSVMPASLTDDYLTFSKDFYNNYQFFMSMDNSDDVTKSANITTRRAYLNMHIDSYNFRGENTETGITNDIIEDYYDNWKYNTIFESKMDELVSDKTGTENISFALENIMVEPQFEDTDGDGVKDKPVPKVSKLSVKRGTTGKDVIIFYNTRRYNVKTDKLVS